MSCTGASAPSAGRGGGRAGPTVHCGSGSLGGDLQRQLHVGGADLGERVADEGRGSGPRSAPWPGTTGTASVRTPSVEPHGPGRLEAREPHRFGDLGLEDAGALVPQPLCLVHSARSSWSGDVHRTSTAVEKTWSRCGRPSPSRLPTTPGWSPPQRSRAGGIDRPQTVVTRFGHRSTGLPAPTQGVCGFLCFPRSEGVNGPPWPRSAVVRGTARRLRLPAGPRDPLAFPEHLHGAGLRRVVVHPCRFSPAGRRARVALAAEEAQPP